MLHQLLASPPPMTSATTAAAAAGDYHLSSSYSPYSNTHYWPPPSTSGSNTTTTTVVVQQQQDGSGGEEKREYILLTRMQPAPLHQSTTMDHSAGGQEAEMPFLFPLPSNAYHHLHLQHPLQIEGSCYVHQPLVAQQINVNQTDKASISTAEWTDETSQCSNNHFCLADTPRFTPQHPITQSLHPSFDDISSGDQKPSPMMKGSSSDEGTMTPELIIEWNNGSGSDYAVDCRTRSSSSSPANNRVCPYCNRSISHLKAKGGIRRHVSYCKGLKLKNASEPKRASLSAASVDPSDPYICRWCRFSTLYKGNVKRHLICCHRVPVSVLDRLQFDVERLRKCSAIRPARDELPIMPRRDGGVRMKGVEGCNEEEEEEWNEEEWNEC